jgi:hypothetical protein
MATFLLPSPNVCMKWGGGGVKGWGWHSSAVLKVFSRLFHLRSVVVWPSDQRVEFARLFVVFGVNLCRLIEAKNAAEFLHTVVYRRRYSRRGQRLSGATGQFFVSYTSCFFSIVLLHCSPTPKIWFPTALLSLLRIGILLFGGFQNRFFFIFPLAFCG